MKDLFYMYIKILGISARHLKTWNKYKIVYKKKLNIAKKKHWIWGNWFERYTMNMCSVENFEQAKFKSVVESGCIFFWSCPKYTLSFIDIWNLQISEMC